MSTSAAAAGDPVPEPGRHLSVVRSDTDELISRLCELAGHIHAANAELIGLLGQLDATGGWQGVGIRSIGHWASIELGIDAKVASAQARAGQRLATVPAIDAAARAGELGWDKLKLLDKVIEPATQARWLTLAREMSVGQLARVTAAYRRASDDTPESTERARRRRGIWFFDEPDGLVRVTALLEPDDAAVLRAALAAHVELLWRQPDGDPDTRPDDATQEAPTTADMDTGEATADPEDGDRAGADPRDETTHPGEPTENATDTAGTTEPGDTADVTENATDTTDSSHTADVTDGPTRVEPATPSEVDPTLAAADPLATRRVDALVSLLRTALTAPDLPDLADDTTQVMIHIDHDLLTGTTDVGRSHHAHGPSIPVTTTQRACCDALIRPLIQRDDQPLDIGRASRTPNRAQRRALRHRDGGCTFPGCQSRYWLDAHHIVMWTEGGATDLDNMVLLCRHHHRLHHEGGYTITMVDGRPRFHRPDGTPIGPPPPPPPDPQRGTPTLRRHHDQSDRAPIDRHTTRANSGGAPHWTPQHALDALLE